VPGSLRLVTAASSSEHQHAAVGELQAAARSTQLLFQFPVPGSGFPVIIRYLANYLTLSRPVNSAFRALADPTRREILKLLRAGPRTSGEIADRFPSTWATISRHLGILRDAKLVLAERDGQNVRYELNTTVFQEVVEHLLDWTKPPRRPNA